jgi:hypothetical protein
VRLEVESRRHAEAEARWKNEQLAWVEAEAALQARLDRLRASPQGSFEPLAPLAATPAAANYAAVPAATLRPEPHFGTEGLAGELREAEARLVAARQRHAEAEAEVERLRTRGALSAAHWQAAEVEVVGGGAKGLVQEGMVSHTADIISRIPIASLFEK